MKTPALPQAAARAADPSRPGRGIIAAAPAPRAANDLKRIHLLQALNDDEREFAFRHIKHRRVETGEILSAEDDLAEHVWFSWTGSYRVTIMSPAGVHVSVRLVEPGAHFGEISILTAAPARDFHLIADQGGVLLALPQEAFRALLFAHPRFTEAVLTSLARIARARAERIFELAALDTRMRLQAELLRLAASRGQACGARVVINPAPTQDSIATEIGATREGVTRHLASLAEQGLIQKRRGEIILLDEARMRANLERHCGDRATLHRPMGVGS